MTIRERQKLREDLVRHAVEAAIARAATLHLTGKCHRAMVLTRERPEEARDLHESCRGEDYGSAGCLCPCHDVVTSTVVSGSVAIQSLPGSV
jgi:hypothetical protein